jgi:hypothetical protein
MTGWAGSHHFQKSVYICIVQPITCLCLIWKIIPKVCLSVGTVCETFIFHRTVTCFRALFFTSDNAKLMFTIIVKFIQFFPEAVIWQCKLEMIACHMRQECRLKPICLRKLSNTYNRKLWELTVGKCHLCDATSIPVSQCFCRIITPTHANTFSQYLLKLRCSAASDECSY